ncbi:hypothetical protein HUG15_05825 [Salicibibacter cibarius]|uniref:Uncharacterized protein n=1 Tax=Salicibibacter cibarius TaxID=2743000 RepID=A0A7T6Z1J9_9BACI|nr:hypothetical protein [Salicibibacter cibarius]QQK75113.1 hypothetical protein HUG15_05495 [Salicibibacter cibarius]QQK75173.1 hypothetical protein HUG15_05825 [Salicibibacter cibarius]
MKFEYTVNIMGGDKPPERLRDADMIKDVNNVLQHKYDKGLYAEKTSDNQLTVKNSSEYIVGILEFDLRYYDWDRPRKRQRAYKIKGDLNI